MTSMAKTKSALLTAVAVLAFSAALAPRLYDGGLFHQGGIANAAENGSTHLNSSADDSPDAAGDDSGNHDGGEGSGEGEGGGEGGGDGGGEGEGSGHD